MACNLERRGEEPAGHPAGVRLIIAPASRNFPFASRDLADPKLPGPSRDRSPRLARKPSRTATYIQLHELAPDRLAIPARRLVRRPLRRLLPLPRPLPRPRPRPAALPEVLVPHGRSSRADMPGVRPGMRQRAPA